MRKIKKVLTPDEYDIMKKITKLNWDCTTVNLDDLYNPESPRYDIAMGNIAQAEELMEEMADRLGFDCPHIDEIPMYDSSDKDLLGMTEEQIEDENAEAVEEIYKRFGVFFDNVESTHYPIMGTYNYDTYIINYNRTYAN